jgi:plasmid stabilization system protein ParE
LNVVWSPEALADVEAAVDYLVERSPPAAEKLATGIVSLIERLATEPLEGLRMSSRTVRVCAAGPTRPFASTTGGRRMVCAERQLDFPMDDDCIAPSMRLGDLA